MGVRAHDRDDRPSADRLLDRIEMFRKVRPGIDDHELALARDVRLRPVISESGRIMGEQPANAGFDLFQLRIRCVHERRLATSRGVLASK
jgi:hypothetical protein